MRRLGVAPEMIDARQLNLSTPVDAITLVVLGAGLALGAFSGSRDLLTVLPALVAAAGLVLAAVLGRRAGRLAGRSKPGHSRLGRTAVASLAAAVDHTRGCSSGAGALAASSGRLVTSGSTG
jgi:hypothetical protein